MTDFKEQSEDSWKFGETVGEWLKRRLNEGKRDFKKYGKKSKLPKTLEQLHEQTGIGHATIYRLKKSKKHFFPSYSTREALSAVIGCYGYPRYIKEDVVSDYYEISTKLLRTNSKCVCCTKEENFFLDKDEFLDDIAKGHRGADYEVAAAYREEELSHGGLEGDEGDDYGLEIRFDEIKEIGRDYHPFKDDYDFLRRRLHIDKFSEESNFVLYVSSICSRLYGAISPWQTEGFEVPLILCKTCLNDLSSYICSPVSDVINLYMKNKGLSQSECARFLDVKQGEISKLLSNQIEFLKPSLINNFFKCLISDDIYHYSFLPERYNNFEPFRKELCMLGYIESDNAASVGCELIENHSLLFRDSRNLSLKSEKPKGGFTINVQCDLIVRSQYSGNVIACFFSEKLDVRRAAFLVAVARYHGATHVCFVLDNPLYMDIISADYGANWKVDDVNIYLSRQGRDFYVCLDIRSGFYRRCFMPFAKTYLEVRAIESRVHYSELDEAMIYCLEQGEFYPLHFSGVKEYFNQFYMSDDTYHHTFGASSESEKEEHSSFKRNNGIPAEPPENIGLYFKESAFVFNNSSIMRGRGSLQYKLFIEGGAFQSDFKRRIAISIFNRSKLVSDICQYYLISEEIINKFIQDLN